MTDQTIPVPVALLKNIKERYPVATGNFDYLVELVALIPAPPKVGDTLTAAQVYDLPPRSTFVDSDQDVYVVGGDREIFRVTNTYEPGVVRLDECLEEDAPYSDFNALRITFIPEDAQPV